MGMFILTDGSFYLKSGDSKRDYLTTRNIDDAIKVTKREANNILAKKSKINWLGRYYYVNILDLDKEDMIENADDKAVNNNQTERGFHFDEDIIKDISNMVQAVTNISFNKEKLNTYKNTLTKAEEYYTDASCDISHIMRDKPDVLPAIKIKLWELGEEICYKRKNIKQALTQVGIILESINSNWNLYGLQKKLQPTTNWDTYKGRTEYYDIALNICNSDENKNAEDKEVSAVETFIKLSKPVLQYDLHNNFIAEFPSMSVASKVTGHSRSGISRCCNGYAQSVSGYIWKFKTGREML